MKYKTIYIFFILLGFFLYINNNALAISNNGSTSIKSNNSVYELSSKWYFNAEDKLKYKEKNLDVSKWNLIYPHFSWTQIEKFKNYYGVSWYRLNIFFEEINNDFALMIPSHYRGAQFFINGNLFHETRPLSSTGVMPSIQGKPDFVNIPTNLLQHGKNVIAIRMWCLNGVGGFVGKLYIGPYYKIKTKWIHYILWYCALAAINIYLTIFFIMLYLKRKNEKYYLFFSGLAFSLAIWIFGYKGLSLWIFDYQWSYIITYVGSIFVPIMLIYFLVSYLNLQKKWLAKVFKYSYYVCALLLLVEYIMTDSILYFVKYLQEPYVMSTGIAFTYGTVLCIKGVRNKVLFSKRILIGSAALTFSLFYSMFDFLDIVKIDSILIEGFFAMTLIFASVLASRFSQMHTDLETAHNELLEMDKMKDEFMATTSHELKTPLIGIEGIAESLLDGATGDLPEVTKINLSMIVSSSKRLSILVNDILDLSKLKHSKLWLQKKPVDMRQVTEIVISFLQTSLARKPIDIKNAITDDIPYIYGDENRLQQIMNNLIGNAIKFTDTGEIIVYAKRVGNFVEIAVEDTGIGIPKDEYGKIFKSFEQLDSSESRKYGGAGLGLSVTKQLVELHNGNIRVESEEDKGTRFIFTLPVYTKNVNLNDTTENIIIDPNNVKSYSIDRKKKTFIGQEVDKDGNPISIIGSDDYDDVEKIQFESRATILVVDDEPVNLHVLENQLGLAGYNTITAINGQEALDLLRKEEIPDIVLLDIMMPGMSGYDVCRKLRKKHTMYDLPVLMFTVKNQMIDIVTGFEAGANDFLSKPFDKRELFARVNTLISLKRTVKEYKEFRHKIIKERTNPHFLFNAIHTIHSLIHTDIKKADNAIIMLADIFRFLADTSFLSLIPFEEEWNFANRYLEFEKLRFPDSIEFEFTIKGNFSKVEIPPLTLQPLIGNSIKHGLRKKIGQGFIKVLAEIDNGTVYLEVVDNGQGIKKDDLFSRTLGDIKNSLEFHYKDSSLTLENRDKGGAVAKISFSAFLDVRR